MPSRKASTFDGTPAKLELFFFFFDLEDLASLANLKDTDKIEYGQEYVTVKTSKLLYSMGGEGYLRAPAATGAAFKKTITALYTGSTDERKYTAYDLRQLAEAQATLRMRNRQDLGEYYYYREFLEIYAYLKDTKKRVHLMTSMKSLFANSRSLSVAGSTNVCV
jgi:hypothetical protein